MAMDLLLASVQLIQRSQSDTGGYPACPAYPPYNFCWFRDGSFVAEAMSRAGDIESAEKFFDWCDGVITAREDKIVGGEKLDARYTLDGQESHEAWSRFQLDGYGLWLWALKNHETRHNKKLPQHDHAVELTTGYLTAHWQEPCDDWWEERSGMHPSTLASIYAGLKAIGNPAAEDVKASIKLEEERNDASLLACPLLGAIDYATFEPYVRKLEYSLVSADGGVYRYKEDEYYGGGEWVLLTAMLGWYYAAIGERTKAEEKLAWVISKADENGQLPEQTQNKLLKPEAYESWVVRNGPPAKPLLWSHAMYIILLDELNKHS